MREAEIVAGMVERAAVCLWEHDEQRIWDYTRADDDEEQALYRDVARAILVTAGAIERHPRGGWRRVPVCEGKPPLPAKPVILNSDVVLAHAMSAAAGDATAEQWLHENADRWPLGNAQANPGS